MRANGNFYSWAALAAFFWSVGGYTLLDSVRTPGPYAEESILLGGTLGGLGVAALFFAFKQRGQAKALAQHMRWDAGSYEGSSRREN
jgi:hypothetical protein